MRFKKLYVGVTGHRVLGDKSVNTFVKKQIKKILLDTKQKYESVTALSAIAEGADILFAEIAVKLGIDLEVVIPFSNYEEDFETRNSRLHYQKLIRQAKKIHRLSFQKRSNKAYLAGGHWLVNHCDLLFAVWNGLPATGEGGTGDVVDFAMQKKRPIIQIHTINKTVHRIEYKKEKHG